MRVYICWLVSQFIVFAEIQLSKLWCISKENAV